MTESRRHEVHQLLLHGLRTHEVRERTGISRQAVHQHVSALRADHMIVTPSPRARWRHVHHGMLNPPPKDWVVMAHPRVPDTVDTRFGVVDPVTWRVAVQGGGEQNHARRDWTHDYGLRISEHVVSNQVGYWPPDLVLDIALALGCVTGLEVITRQPVEEYARATT